MSAIVAQSSDSDSDYEELEPSLRNLVEQTSLKWIFVGGKGGVGKTTSSSSIGVLLSKTRRKVLIISTDPAHNVSDAFSQKFSNEPIQVKGFDNLYAMEIETKNPGEGLITTANDGSGIPEDEGATASIQSMLKELTSAVPGIDECMSFAELMKQVQTMDYDCIVFDTAPTGHTLRLVSGLRSNVVVIECNSLCSDFFELILLLMSFIDSYLSNKSKQCILTLIFSLL